MYPNEIHKFLSDRNYYIGGDDLNFITNTRLNPEFTHVKFNPGNSTYDIWDDNGNYYHFTAMPYKEAQKRGLTKQDDDWER